MPADGDNAASKQRGAKLPKGVHKMRDPVVNPCIPEQDASYKCLNDTNFNRNACGEYFENYKNCMKFWTKVSKDRRKQGVKPHMPTPEEREEILKDMNVPATIGS